MRLAADRGTGRGGRRLERSQPAASLATRPRSCSKQGSRGEGPGPLSAAHCGQYPPRRGRTPAIHIVVMRPAPHGAPIAEDGANGARRSARSAWLRLP
jgi:hypothetical protein